MDLISALVDFYGFSGEYVENMEMYQFEYYINKMNERLEKEKNKPKISRRTARKI